MGDEVKLSTLIQSWWTIVPAVAAGAWLASSFVIGFRHPDALVRKASLALLGVAISLMGAISSYIWAATDDVWLPRLAEAVLAVVAGLGLLALALELAGRGRLDAVRGLVSLVGLVGLAGTAAVLIIETGTRGPGESLVSHWYLAAGHAVGAAALVMGLAAGAGQIDIFYGFRRSLGTVAGFLGDVAGLSARRVLAIARLAVQEAIRRKVLLVFLFFALIFMFAGWWLEYKDNQVKVYVSFVSKVTAFFVILVTIIMASTSLPTDVTTQTIHTVVTKPVRRMEILLGRIVGYLAVGTAFLVVMGLVSLVYMDRRISDEQRQKHMVARVPIYGKLHFERGKGERRVQLKEGVDVGYEYKRWSYIAGGERSTQTAVWEFEGIDLGLFGEAAELPLEMSFTVFRSTKGVIGEGVMAQLTFINPQTQARSPDPLIFPVTEYRDKNRAVVPREYVSADGRLRIECRCLSPSQYLGMAEQDLYLLPAHRSFALNFLKGLVGTWLQVAVVAVVAVTVSTFLSGLISMLVTIAVYFAGNLADYLADLAAGQVTGGGPIEAVRRLVEHQNVVAELPDDFWRHLTRNVDDLYRFLVDLFQHVVPNMTRFDTTSLVANGFDVPGAVIGRGLVLMIGYVLPCVIFGCFCLKGREIAK